MDFLFLWLFDASDSHDKDFKIQEVYSNPNHYVHVEFWLDRYQRNSDTHLDVLSLYGPDPVSIWVEFKVTTNSR